MENEPEKPRSSAPPPPDLPPPPSAPAMPPPPDLAARGPSSPPMPDLPPTPPPVAPPVVGAAKSAPLKMDSQEGDDDPKPGTDATFEARAVAAIIDSFVAAGIYLVLALMWRPLGTLALLGYFLTRDALPFLEGQSIGKKIMKLRAVTLEGKSLTANWQASMVRNLSLVIPFFALVEAYILYSRQGREGALQRLGDEWAKTRVVVASEPSAI
jgi:uncharacterized RDD family membrane protein YckC